MLSPMTAEPTPAPPDALPRELTEERIPSARRMNVLRFVGVSAFLASLRLAALRLLEKREQFDLTLCDLMMPAMTGMELHDELSRLDSSQAARMSFLTEKPFDPQGLRSFVRALV